MGEEVRSWQAAATANIWEARKRNGRLGSKKSRGGCSTCKIRRVKCGEERPACYRCTSTGRKCDGYADINITKGGHTHLNASLAPFTALRDYDRRAFDFFLSFSAPRLAGSLDKTLWCGYVLQIAQAEPFVLDSILAISILYEHPQYLGSFRHGSNEEPISQQIGGGMKTPAFRTGSAAQPSSIDLNHADALRAYNRAINGFSQKMTDGKATAPYALLSCLLFICIETIRDNVFAALALLTKGSDLLKQLDGRKFSGQEQQLASMIKLMFARIGGLAVVFDNPHTVDTPPDFLIVGQKRIFATLHDARTALYALMADSHPFIQRAAVYKAMVQEALGGNLDLSMAPSASTLTYTREDRICEAASAVLPMVVNLKPGDRAATVYSGQGGVSDAGTQMRTPPLSHKGRTRILQRADGFYGQMPRLCDCERDICRAYDEEFSVSRTAASSAANGSFLTGQASIRRDRVHAEHELPTPVLTSPEPCFVELLSQQTQLEARLGQWYDAFHWARSPTNATPEAISSLLMYYHVSSIWHTTRLAMHETVFDQYTFHFLEILKHAEIYVQINAAASGLVFTFEVGAVPPLYFVACKCRHPGLRRKALELLARAPRKECMWGATSTAELAAKVIEIEEEGMGLPCPTSTGASLDAGCGVAISDVLPSEESRVHTLELMKNKLTGRFEVKVTRFRPTHGGDRLRRVVQDYTI